jgi:DNA-binding transcriptional regulator YhcF (GntR family)
MISKTFSSVTDQVTEHLRQGMVEGRWRGTLPGRKALAAELGCSQGTVEEAMRRLAGAGLLVSQGAGRRQRIELSKAAMKPRGLRMVILCYEGSDHTKRYILELVHRLQAAGHSPVLAEKTLHGLGMDVTRIAGFVQKTAADAWVVVAGSRGVLEWFSQCQTAAFGVFGRQMKVSLAGSYLNKADALLELVDRLVGLGHRRVVLLAREERRKPTPGFMEQLFLDRLAERGIPTGPYNLPDWDDNPEGLRQILDSLFAHTPPTALVLDEPQAFFASIQHFAALGISAPQHVSLACMDADTTFDWGLPSITHITWDCNPIITRVVKWADNISRGRDDRRKSAIKAKLVAGGTIGPVPEGHHG